MKSTGRYYRTYMQDVLNRTITFAVHRDRYLVWKKNIMTYTEDLFAVELDVESTVRPKMRLD